METFEIHITGDESIITVAKDLKIKTIVVDLLTPKRESLRHEYMTSLVYKAESYPICKTYVDDLVDQLESHGVQIKRVKIESPIYDHYIKDSLYIESHFPATDWQYPVSRNIKKQFKLATDREYDVNQYHSFMNLHEGKEFELCLYDTNTHEDMDWITSYKKEQ